MKTYARLLFAMKKSFQYRHQLRHIRQHAASTLADINFLTLKNQGIKTIVFDYDGVLSAHGKLPPESMGIALLDQATRLFDHVCILSNQQSPKQQAYFAAVYPTVQVIQSVCKKPHPQGLQRIMQDTHTLPHQLCVIDDRLMTGCLAGLLVGAKIIFITDPLQDYKHARTQESWFNVLRALERLLF